MIGIFGGTFDPVHYGHIKPALAVKENLKLSQIRFIPNRKPPHRAAPWLNVEQRLSLLTEALQDYPDVIVDQRELNRTGPSYMVETLHSLKEDFPKERFVLIIGMDVFYNIATWHKWKSLFDLCHLVVTMRPGFQQCVLVGDGGKHIDAKNRAFIIDKMIGDAVELMKHESGKILLQSVPQVDVSATQIRKIIVASEQNSRNETDSDTEIISELMPRSVYRKLRGLIDDN